MHVIYYLGGLSNLIGVSSIIEEPTPIPLISRVVVTLTPLLPSQVQPTHKPNGVGNTREKVLFFSETRVEKSINKGKTFLVLFVLEKGEGKIRIHPLAQRLTQ